MKVGIYLGFGREYKNYPFFNQGLGRYLSFILKGLISSGNEISVVYPYWFESVLNELYEHYKIDKAKITHITIFKKKTIWDYYFDYLQSKSHKNNKSNQAKDNEIKLQIQKIIEYLIRIENPLFFALVLLAVFIVTIIFSPIVFLIFILYLSKILIQKVKNKKKNVKIILKNIRLFVFLKEIRLQFHTKLDIVRRVRNDYVQVLINHINTKNIKQDIWFCPMLFWPEFLKINGTKVITAPDLVTEEFPGGFSEQNIIQSSLDCSKTLSEGKNFIVFCEFIKKSLLIDRFAKDPNNVYVIPHANNELYEEIDVQSKMEHMLAEGDVNKIFARKKILQANKFSLSGSHYLKNFSFDSTKYLFFPTQIRPNKNLYSLLKAMHYINQELNQNMKLFLTLNPNEDNELIKFIYDLNLTNDIVFFQNASNQELAALYLCAELVVNTSLYEGGFPFTFAEGMSVGTPSVMSRIPQVTDVTKSWKIDDCIFDPYDWRDIAEKITYALNNRDKILKQQKLLYKHLSKRSWSNVGQEYVEAFQYFINS